MKIQIYFCFRKIFRSVFNENTNLLLFLKKKFWWLIADFEIKEELKHVNQLKNILTKHTNMAYINCEQDHNEIKHILIKTMQWTTQTYQIIEKKK